MTPCNEGDFKMEKFPSLDNLYVFVGFIVVDSLRYGHLHKVNFERFIYIRRVRTPVLWSLKGEDVEMLN